MKYIALMMACAALLPAETKSEKGRRIVDEALTALGGEKFRAMKDRLEDGRAYSFYRDRLTGLAKAKVYTRYLNGAPAGGVAQRERQSFGKDEDYLILFTEDKAYQVTYRGAQPLPEDRWKRYVESTRANILYILHSRLDEKGLIFESRGTDIWQNTPVEVVDITDAENNVITVYFQASTKLPLRQMWTTRDEETRQKTDHSIVFAKYRDVGGGVQWPYNVLAERNGSKVFEMYADSVTIDQGFTDELFTLSSRMKIID